MGRIWKENEDRKENLFYKAIKNTIIKEFKKYKVIKYYGMEKRLNIKIIKVRCLQKIQKIIGIVLRRFTAVEC